MFQKRMQKDLGGHLGIATAIFFGYMESVLSDGAKLTIDRSISILMQPDWKKVFIPESPKEQVAAIIGGVTDQVMPNCCKRMAVERNQKATAHQMVCKFNG